MPESQVKIIVRPLEKSDLGDIYLQWFEDPEIFKYLEIRNLTGDAALAHLQHGQRTREWMQYAICLADSGRLVGTTKLGPVKWRHGLSDLSTIIGARDVWGRGIGTEAVRQTTEIAFREHGLRRLSAGIYGSNTKSLATYLRAGWFEEARLKDHYVFDGALTDRVIVSCINPARNP